NMQMFGNLTNGGWHWPATHSDGYSSSFSTGEAYGYLATNYTTSQYMGMGALLAIPPSPSLSLETVVGTKLAWTLQNYGGYIVDDSYDVPSQGVPGNRQALCMEQGVLFDLNATYGFTFPVYCSTDSPILR